MKGAIAAHARTDQMCADSMSNDMPLHVTTSATSTGTAMIRIAGGSGRYRIVCQARAAIAGLGLDSGRRQRSVQAPELGACSWSEPVQPSGTCARMLREVEHARNESFRASQTASAAALIHSQSARHPL